MKTINFLVIAVITSFLMLSCGGNEELDENDENVETNDEVETVDVETELEPQIAEDLDNATFKQYWDEKGGVLIDLRSPSELTDGFIEGSVNIDYNAGEFDAAMDTLDTTVPTFVYCHGGGRSGQAMSMLNENGFLEVYNLQNGYSNWEE